MTNTPIIEVIAELRWGPGNPSQPAVFSFGDDADYIKFGVEASRLGYNQLERTIPQGVPSPGGAIGYRYRKGEGDLNTLYQLGTGIFSANGLPPYTSWGAFRQVLVAGVEALNATVSLNTRGEVWCVVRYVDFFASEHMGGLNTQEFFRNVVGVESVPLNSVMEFAGDDLATSMRFFRSAKDPRGNEVALDVGEGQNGERPGIVMNTSVTSAPLVNPSVDEVLASFDLLQKVAHEVFFEMIERDNRVKHAIFPEA